MAGAQVFVLPDLGEGLQEAEIVAWHVAEGDHVVADQPLVSVETDKAVVDIPAPHAGRVARLLAAVHAHLPIGAPLVEFAVAEGQDAGTVVGELGMPAAPAVQVPAPGPVPGPAPGPAPGPVPVAAAVRPAAVRAAPAVRVLAAAHGIDLASVTGTGPDGEITRADVDRVRAAQPPADNNGPGVPVEPLRGVRRAMALRMAEAGRAVVPATVTEEVDVEAWPAGTSVAARLVGALVAGCRAEPALNAAFDGTALTRRLNAAVHVGLAVDTEDGLIVPVLRDAGQLDAAGLDAALAALVAAARTRRLPPEDLRGATVSLSNFGALGGQFAALVVVPPQVAILGAGRIRPRVVAAAGGFAARRMLPLSLTFDHRAVSGGEAARFLAAVMAALERAA